jgi:Cu(I)/Ag(I) efflux system membrane fusion protein
MTLFPLLRRTAPPVAAAVATATVFTIGLWIQRSREQWPFAPLVESTMAVTLLPEAAVASTSGTAPAHGRVAVDLPPSDVASLDIRLDTVRRESVTQAVRAAATVVPDESRISHVHTRVAGWLEELNVSTTGQTVQAGQPVARIFSQELLSSQTEYLAARRNAASGIASVVVAGGRTRLGVLGMTTDEIDAIDRTGEPMRLVTVAAPRGGVVVHRGVTVGTAVDPSTELLTIADLSRVWVLAEVPEADIPFVRAGTAARLDFPASGRPPLRARVDFVYPMLTERTRTLRVRLSVANPGGALKPGLYGTAIFEPAGRSALTVPRDAVVDTGREQHVFVVSGGMFEPRAVTVGARVADRIEIRDGLAEGEQIVAAGVFLLDSESRLRATGGAGGHAHGGPADPSGPGTPAPATTTGTPAPSGHAGH